MVLIGVIVGLAIVALMLASVSLLLIRRSRNSKMTNFSKNNSLKGNIYSHQPNTDTIRVSGECKPALYNFVIYKSRMGTKTQMSFRK